MRGQARGTGHIGESHRDGFNRGRSCTVFAFFRFFQSGVTGAAACTWRGAWTDGARGGMSATGRSCPSSCLVGRLPVRMRTELRGQGRAGVPAPLAPGAVIAWAGFWSWRIKIRDVARYLDGSCAVQFVERALDPPGAFLSPVQGTEHIDNRTLDVWPWC